MKTKLFEGNYTVQTDRTIILAYSRELIRAGVNFKYVRLPHEAMTRAKMILFTCGTLVYAAPRVWDETFNLKTWHEEKVSKWQDLAETE